MYLLTRRVNSSIKAKLILKFITFRTCFVLGFSGGIFPVIGWCHVSPLPLPLRDLVQGAEERDSRMSEARAQIMVSGTKIDAANSAYQPSLDLSTRTSHNKRWGSATQLSTDKDCAVVNSVQMKCNIFRSYGDVKRSG